MDPAVAPKVLAMVFSQPARLGVAIVGFMLSHPLKIHRAVAQKTATSISVIELR